MNHKLAAGVSLVLGGARSGKSRFGERLVEAAGLEAIYVATGQAHDAEMAARVDAHRRRRGPNWRTVEVPVELAAALRGEDGEGRAILVDCLTLWVTNLMVAGADVAGAGDELVATLARMQAPVVLVASEVGLGIVPENAMARAFRDHAGKLNQDVAAIAKSVYFVAAGLPLALKQE